MLSNFANISTRILADCFIFYVKSKIMWTPCEHILCGLYGTMDNWLLRIYMLPCTFPDLAFERTCALHYYLDSPAAKFCVIFFFQAVLFLLVPKSSYPSSVNHLTRLHHRQPFCTLLLKITCFWVALCPIKMVYG